MVERRRGLYLPRRLLVRIDIPSCSMKKVLFVLLALTSSLFAQKGDQTPDVVGTPPLYVAIDEVAPPLGLNRLLEDKVGGPLHDGGTVTLPRFVAGQSIPLQVYFIDQHSTSVSGPTTVRHIRGFHRYQTSVVTVQLRAAGNNHVYSAATGSSEIAGPFVTATVTRLAAGSDGGKEMQKVEFSDTSANGTFRVYTDFPEPGGTSTYVNVRQARRGWSVPISK